MIYGPRVRLRHVERTDLPRFVEWLNDPEVRAGLALFLPMSTVEEEKWFETMIQRPAVERTFSVEIPEGDGWRLIGSTGLFDFDWRNRSAEFGILVGDKSLWNRGYGTEVTRLMLDHGFGTLNLHRVHLRVFSDNPRARRAYEKAGYTLEGTLRESRYVGGTYHDTHIMSVLRTEWTPLEEEDARTA